jgi:hypothetical protein
MKENFLRLNEDKTEILVLGSKNLLGKLSVPVINVGDVGVEPAEQARNIGFIFDRSMSLKNQIMKTCQTAWYHLRCIGKIRPFLDTTSTERIIHAFVTSKLDFCNSLYNGLPNTLLSKLQRIQNAAARIVSRTNKYDHITPVLAELHWLPVSYRCQFKILLLVYKALHDLAPIYLKNMLQRKPTGERSLRSDNKNLLIVPKVSSSYGSRSFYYSAPVLWNSLSQDVRDAKSLDIFKSLCKRDLFKSAFNA